MENETYQISEAERLTGEKAHVLRYWEEELGLTIGRNAMGHRFYTAEDIQIFLSIKELKKKGLHLKAIRDLLPKLRQAAGQAVQVETIPGEVVEILPARSSVRREAAKSQEQPFEVCGDEQPETVLDIKPVDGTGQTVAAVAQPVGSTSQSAAAVAQPAGSAGQPAGDVTQPAGSTSQSAAAVTQPAGSAGQPVAAMAQPVETVEPYVRADKKAENPPRKKAGKSGKTNSGKTAASREEQQEQFFEILDRLLRQLVLKKRQEERYRRVDEAIRKHQQSRKEVAATTEQSGKKRKKT